MSEILLRFTFGATKIAYEQGTTTKHGIDYYYYFFPLSILCFYSSWFCAREDTNLFGGASVLLHRSSLLDRHCHWEVFVNRNLVKDIDEEPRERRRKGRVGVRKLRHGDIGAGE
jgi:hypothetical protein